MSIDNIIAQVQTLQNNLEGQAIIFLTEDKKKIIDLVRIDQLFNKGEDADGNRLKPYTPFTRKVKIKEGRNPEIVSLFDEGDYYKGFDFTLISGEILNIFSRDFKARELSEKYGSRIDDLNDENEEKVNTNLEEELITWVLQSIKI